MVTMRLAWADLPAATLTAVTARTGTIHTVTEAEQGGNSQIAATLYTDTGRVFVKGLRRDHPQAWTQHREASINPHVVPIAPRLLWQVTDGTWHLLGFEHLTGRAADYRPGSPDLPLVADAIGAIAAVPAPDDVDLKLIDQRLADYLDSPDDALLLRGDTLAHTDWTPTNVLITDVGARMVDWAWPTRGAAWIDPACWAVWLIASGNTPHQAEQRAATIPAWADAPVRGLTVFATAQHRLWAGIAAAAPDIAWKGALADAAARWAAHRKHPT